MTIKNFIQQDFLDYESDSSGFDVFASPDNLVMAKDATSFVQNAEVVLNRHLSNIGLVNSWALEDNNPNCILNLRKSQTTDNALAALFFFINGEEDKAKNIFQYYLLHLPATFTVGTSQIYDWVNLKDNTTGETQALSTAYLLYSVCYYQSQTKNTQFRQLALFCAQQLMDLFNPSSGLIKDDYSSQKCSMEANSIAYLGFKLLAPFTNNPDIISFRDNLKSQIPLVLGLKDNTLSASFTPNSLIFSGIFSSSIGNKFVLDSAKTFLKQNYITEQNRVIGIGTSDYVEFKETLAAAIFYFKISQPSISYSFNSAILESFLENQSFISTDKVSSAEQLLWFLILNKIIIKDFIVEELFK